MLRTRKLAAAIWILGLAALAAGAAPALTADSGTLVATVSVPAPPAPCITLSDATHDYGVMPFSTPTAVSSRGFALILNNCGAAANVLASATNASGPSGSWTLFAWPTFVGNNCPTTNTFSLLWGISDANFQSFSLSGTPRMGTSTSGTPWVVPAGQVAVSNLGLFMPCQGSNGAGESKTFTALFTAVVS